MTHSVTKHTLDNGMTVLLKEMHHAPLISWWVLYRVGSRNERTGLTGVSHWVEHMLFKGTEKFPAGHLDRAIDRVGGAWNAQTSLDHTAYFETLPADQIELALELEADRMGNAMFEPHEVSSERTVIISERQGIENYPQFWLEEEVQAAAFRVHGYHHEIIGDMADLETMTRDDLYHHYRQHYTPSNAIAVAVGAFDSDTLLRQIESHYAGIPSGERPNTFVRPEPEQQGERRITVERPGETAYIEVGYRAPAASAPDWFALSLLNSVMCGTGDSNKTSRLYKALIETELAAEVDGSLRPTIDPFLYTIDLTARDPQQLQALQNTLDDEIERLQNDGITADELTRAKKQARAYLAYSVERVTMQAYQLATAENFATYEWFENLPQRLEAVTIDDVQRVAQTYLLPRRRTVGWLIPTGDPALNGANGNV